MKKGVVTMKLYIHSSEDLMYNSYINHDKWLPRLKIKPSQVKSKLLDNVKSEDKEIMQYLIDSKVIPTCATSKDLRENPYYNIEDKFIRLYSNNEDSRSYYVPYAGTGRFGAGRVFENSLTVYDDGRIQFGDGEIRNPHDYSSTTLKKYFFKEQ